VRSPVYAYVVAAHVRLAAIALAVARRRAVPDPWPVLVPNLVGVAMMTVFLTRVRRGGGARA
jgi:hypothetical protein